MTATSKKNSPLDDALAHQRRGDLAAAEAGFRTMLAQDTENPDASILLGEICRKSGRAEEAVGLVMSAIATAPKLGARSIPPGGSRSPMRSVAGCGVGPDAPASGRKP